MCSFFHPKGNILYFYLKILSPTSGWGRTWSAFEDGAVMCPGTDDTQAAPAPCSLKQRTPTSGWVARERLLKTLNSKGGVQFSETERTQNGT